MNPFDELLKETSQRPDEPSVFISVGDYTINTTVLLTDDLAAIFHSFVDDEDMIVHLIEYSNRLPYSIKIDLMFYLSDDKKGFKKLKKIKGFKKFIDGFAAAITDLKLK